MGIIVIVVFLLQLLLTFTSAFLSTVTTPHLVYEYTALIGTMQTLLIKWGGWILLFTNFVPISLIVSLEMVKYIQGTNISASVYQTNAPAEVVVQTSTLNEELGQIQHLFSDKTGTLTKNYMSFKYCAIGSKVYGLDSTPSVIPHSITNVDFHDREFLRSVS